MTFTASTLWKKKWFVFPPTVLLLWVLVESTTGLMPTVLQDALDRYEGETVFTGRLKPDFNRSTKSIRM